MKFKNFTLERKEFGNKLEILESLKRKLEVQCTRQKFTRGFIASLPAQKFLIKFLHPNSVFLTNMRHREVSPTCTKNHNKIITEA